MKKWIKYLVTATFLIMGLSMAKTVFANTLFTNGQIIESGREQDFGGIITYGFKYDGQSVYVGYLSIEDGEQAEYSNNELELSIREYSALDDGRIIESISLKKYTEGFVCAGSESLKFGHYYEICINNADEGGPFNIYYRVEKYAGYAQSVKITSSLNMKIGDRNEIKIQSISPYGSLPDINWKSSNSNIATVDDFGRVEAKNKGNCTITGILKNGAKAECIVTVSVPAPYINYYAYTLNKGQTAKLKICYANKKIKWSSSNKKVATVTASGKVKAKKVGKCIITAKIGKKKYTCKVNVVYRNPDFSANLIKYDTRNNCFVVEYTNWSNRTLYINPGKTKVEDCDYRRYDRNLRIQGGKTIAIKPKKTKKIKFYVQGSRTWYDYTDFTLFYRFTYDGKKYEGHVWWEDSVYKKGKKWYTTYWVD